MANLFVVVDEGSNQGKSFWSENNQFGSDIIPSKVSTGYAEVSSTGFAQPFVYEIDGIEYKVTDQVAGIDTAGKSYQISNENLALVHEILRRNHGGKTVDLAVTMPIDLFYQSDNRRNLELIEQKKKNLMRSVVNLAGEPLAIINSVDVKPEGIPIWFDLLFDDQLQFNSKFENVERVMVVDIGGTTVDICVLTGGGEIILQDSIDIGCTKILNRLRDKLTGEARPSSSAIEQAVKNKTYRGQDITADIKQASAEVVAVITSKLNILSTDPLIYDHIVYAGGGANLIGKLLDASYGGNTLIPSEPEMSLARGILKRKLIADQQIAAQKAATAEA